MASSSSLCQGVTIYNFKPSVSNYSREGVSKRGARRCHLPNVPGPVRREEERLREKAGRGAGVSCPYLGSFEQASHQPVWATWRGKGLE